MMIDVGGLFRELVHQRQIAPEAVVIESVTYDELVRDADADVVDPDVFLVCFGLEEQRRDLEMLDVLGLENRFELLYGVSRIDDVLDDDHAAAFQVLIEPDELPDFVGRRRAFVRRKFHKAYLARKSVFLEDVGNDHECAVKDSDKDRSFFLMIVFDVLDHFGNREINFLF